MRKLLIRSIWYAMALCRGLCGIKVIELTLLLSLFLSCEHLCSNAVEREFVLCLWTTTSPRVQFKADCKKGWKTKRCERYMSMFQGETCLARALRIEMSINDG